MASHATLLTPEYSRASVPVTLDNSVEQHLGQMQDALEAAQKSPITLDELESIKIIAEEQIRRSDEALARLSQRADKLKESRASLLQKADKNIMDMRSPQPQLVRPSPPVARLSPFRSPPAPSKAASYLSSSPATVQDRSQVQDRSPDNSVRRSVLKPDNSVRRSVLNSSSLPVTSSHDEELASLGELGARLSQTFAKMELLGQDTNKPRGIPGKQVSPDISLTEEISSIQREREELQKRYRHAVESKLMASSLPNSARGSGSGSISSFQQTQLTPIVHYPPAQQSPRSRWSVDVDPSLNNSVHPSSMTRLSMPRAPVSTTPNPLANHLGASEKGLPQYQPLSSASAATWAQVNPRANPRADRAAQPSPLEPPSPQTQEQFRQATAMLKESFTEAKVDRNTLAVMRKSKASPGGESLVGLHVPLEIGLRVKSVDPSLEYTDGGAGIITRIHDDVNACFVKWDAREEECGWYKCGVRGYYALKLVPKEEEGPMLPDNLVCTGGNSKMEVEERRSHYEEENMFAADKAIMDFGDFLGSW